MNLRVRLALFSSLVTFVAIALLVIFSYLALERSLVRDLDEELRVQANVILNDVLQDGAITQETEVTLTTNSGSSSAWTYRNNHLTSGVGILAAPEPLDQVFLESQRNTASASVGSATVAGWRVSSVRQNEVTVQVGRSVSGITRTLENYVRSASIAGLIAVLLAGLATTLLVERSTRSLEQLVRRVEHLESNDLIPGIAARDEVGALARALATSLETLQRTRSREARFLADAAHELRTPVAAMLADLDHHSARNRSSEEDQAVIKRTRGSVRHLRELSSNLLTLTQSERSLERHSVDLFVLCGDVVDLLAPLAAAKGLELSLDGAPVVVLGDAMMLERALTNLIGNAIKFTDHGEVRVQISRLEHEAKIEVIDTGAGINPEILERIFEPFERGGETQREGSGLGLAVVKAVIEAHGGRVRLESETGFGTKAIMILLRA
jgi:signal transduction histidine kinase